MFLTGTERDTGGNWWHCHQFATSRYPRYSLHALKYDMIVSSVVLVITQSISVSLRFGICTDQLFLFWTVLVAKLVATATSFVTTWDFANSHPISKKLYAKCRYGQTLLIYDSTIMKYDQLPITINVSKTEIFRFRIADLSSKIRWMEEVEWSDPKKNIKKS